LQSHWAALVGATQEGVCEEKERIGKIKQRYLSEELALVELSSPAGIEQRKRDIAKNLGGRISGSSEWVTSRGEAGTLGSSSGFFIGNDNDDIVKTNVHGGDHTDTVPFSDEHVIRKSTEDSGIPSLSSVSLYDDSGKYLNGIKCEWRDGSSNDHSTAGNVEATSISLSPGEYITSVSARVGSLVDYLELKTNTGRSISAGNCRTGSPIVYSIPDGMHVIGFTGGMGREIHNIGLLLAPIMVSEDHHADSAHHSLDAEDTNEDITATIDFDEDEEVTKIFTSLVGKGMKPSKAASEAIKIAKMTSSLRSSPQ
jgi:hypothetical protein